MFNREFLEYISDEYNMPIDDAYYHSEDGDVCMDYAYFLMDCTGLSLEEIIILSNGKYCNLEVDGAGTIISCDERVDTWKVRKDGHDYRYDLKENKFYMDKTEVSVDKINEIFSEDFFVRNGVLYHSIDEDDVDYKTESMMEEVFYKDFLMWEATSDGEFLPGEAEIYMKKCLETLPEIVDYGMEMVFTPDEFFKYAENSPYTAEILCRVWNYYFGGDGYRTMTPCLTNDASGLSFKYTLSVDESKIPGGDYIPENYIFNEKKIIEIYSRYFSDSLGVDIVPFEGGDTGDLNGSLSMDHFTSNLLDFSNQNFTIKYNGCKYTVNFADCMGEDIDNPVEVVSNYLNANSGHAYEDLGIVLSLRNDTSNAEQKLLFSGNISNVELDGNLYKVIFNNGQVATFSEEEYNGILSSAAVDSSNISLEELIGYSEANVCCEASRIFSEYFGGSAVDVRVVSPEKCMVVINGVEYEYSTDEVFKIMQMYNDKDVSQIKLDKISQYLNINYKYEVVLNPITNQYVLKRLDKEGYVELDRSLIDMDKLMSSDAVKTLLKENPDFDINSLSTEQLLQLMVGDMGIANFDTAEVPINSDTSKNTSRFNKYMSEKMFEPIISIEDTDVYLNFAKYLNEIDMESIKSKASNAYNSYLSSFNNGGFVNSVISNFSEIDNNIKTLGKQINYSISLLMNYDVSLKDELNKLIEEFFEVSSVSYEGNNKIDLVNEKNNEVSEFFKSKKEEFYRKANEISLALTGYVVLTEEQKEILKAEGYTFSSFSARDITGDENASDEKNYYCISMDDCDKILSKYYDVAPGENYIENIYMKLKNDVVFDSKTGKINENETGELGSIDVLSMKFYNLNIDYTNSALMEEMVNKQRASYAYANLSPYYETLFSKSYIDTLNDMRLNIDKYLGTDDNPYGCGYFDYCYDDSLTLGMNALFYNILNSDVDEFNNSYFTIYDVPQDKCFENYQKIRLLADKYGFQIPEFSEEMNLEDQYNCLNLSLASFYNFFDVKKYEAIQNFNDLQNKLKSPKASESLLSYNYVKMKGYEKAVKYLEGVYEDGEIDFGDWLNYVGKCLGEGFVTTFSGFADMINPEYDSNDYMKSFLAEMMVSSDMDMEKNQKRYQAGEISSAEYNLKKVIIDAYESGDMRLETLSNWGKGANVFGQIGFEVLLTAITMGVGSHIATGLTAAASTRVLSAAKMLRDVVMVGKGIGENKKNYIHSKYGDLYYAIADFETDRLNENANRTAWSAAGLQFVVRNISNIYGLTGGDYSDPKSTFLKKLKKVGNSAGKFDKGNYNQMTGGKLKGKQFKYELLYKDVTDEAGGTDLVFSAGWAFKQSDVTTGDFFGATVRNVVNNVITGFGFRGSQLYIPVYNFMGTKIYKDLEEKDQKDFISLSWDKGLLYILRGVTGIDVGVKTN